MKFIFIYSFIFFCLGGCGNRDICKSIKDSALKSQDNCLDLSLIKKFNWDTLYIISSHVYPDEIEKVIGINYNYEVHTDPNEVLLYVKDNKIIKRECGRCNQLDFSRNMQRNGIVKLSHQHKDCLQIKKMTHGGYFLSYD